MVHRKYIKRGDKVFGPYLYESKRVNGKVVTRYIGKDEAKKGREIYSAYFITSALVIILLLFFGAFYVADIQEKGLVDYQSVGRGDRATFFDFVRGIFGFGEEEGGVGEKGVVMLQPACDYDVSECGALSEEGAVYCLKNDISNVAGDCFVIGANDITLYGEGHSVSGGLGAGVGVDNRDIPPTPQDGAYDLTLEDIVIESFLLSVAGDGFGCGGAHLEVYGSTIGDGVDVHDEGGFCSDPGGYVGIRDNSAYFENANIAGDIVAYGGGASKGGTVSIISDTVDLTNVDRIDSSCESNEAGIVRIDYDAGFDDSGVLYGYRYGNINLDVIKRNVGEIDWSYSTDSVIISGAENMGKVLELSFNINIGDAQIEGVSVNVVNLPEFNQPAKVTFFGSPAAGLTNPVILKDGAFCSNCKLLTDLESDTEVVSFVVPDFNGVYTIGELYVVLIETINPVDGQGYVSAGGIYNSQVKVSCSVGDCGDIIVGLEYPLDVHGENIIYNGDFETQDLAGWDESEGDHAHTIDPDGGPSYDPSSSVQLAYWIQNEYDVDETSVLLQNFVEVPVGELRYELYGNLDCGWGSYVEVEVQKLDDVWGLVETILCDDDGSNGYFFTEWTEQFIDLSGFDKIKGVKFTSHSMYGEYNSYLVLDDIKLYYPNGVPISGFDFVDTSDVGKLFYTSSVNPQGVLLLNGESQTLIFNIEADENANNGENADFLFSALLSDFSKEKTPTFNIEIGSAGPEYCGSDYQVIIDSPGVYTIAELLLLQHGIDDPADFVADGVSPCIIVNADDVTVSGGVYSIVNTENPGSGIGIDARGSVGAGGK